MGRKGSKLTRGIGINDADYDVFKRLPEGKVWHCPIYRLWANMLTRCTSEDGKYSYDYTVNHNSQYVGVKVSEEWRTFSVFREWVVQRNWEGNHLDKDLLGDGKLYSADTCCFLPSSINSQLALTGRNNGLLLGVSSLEGVFLTSVFCEGVPLLKQKRFKNEQEAHFTWLKYKGIALSYLAEKHLFDGNIDLRTYEALKIKSQKLQYHSANRIPLDSI